MAALALVGASARAAPEDADAGTDGSPVRLEPETAADLRAMFARARKEGIPREALAVRAAYRPRPPKTAPADAITTVFGRAGAVPWRAAASEHITGKSVDIELGPALTIANAEAKAFDKLPAYRWLLAHAHEFGFNHAFPGEPWHFTHHLPPGTTPGPLPGYVGLGPLGSVLRPRGATADLAARILTGDAVAWSPRSATLIYAQCWREEGGGDGCVVRAEEIRRHRILHEWPVFSPGQADLAHERREKMDTACTALLPRLKGATALAAVPWPASQTTLALGERLTVAWDAQSGALDVNGGDGGPRVSVHVRRLPPWTPRPLRAYAGPDLVVVELVHDPGDAFVDGANLVSVIEIVPLR
jgi:hypothetical protein